MSEENLAIRPFSILMRARPRRIAFLIDPANCPDDLIDKLFEVNYGLWGGRYNPLVPVVDQAIPDSYWSVLEFADPDIIYSYCDLTPATIARLERDISPMRIERHPRLREGASPSYYPSFCHEQVTIHAVLPQALARKPVLGRKQKLLTSGTSWDWPHRRQVLRNFGLLEEIMARKPYDEEQERLTIQDDWTEEDVFERIAGERNGVIFPFQASELHAEFPEAAGSYQHEYCLIIGNGAQEWIYFWNRIFLLSAFRRSSFCALCIAPERLKEETYPQAVHRFLRAHVLRSGNSSPRIDVVSFSESPDSLQSISASLLNGMDAYRQVLSLSPNEFPEVGIKQRAFPSFDRSTTSFEREPVTQQQGTARTCLLSIPDSPVDLSRGTWILDLRVEHVPQHRFYSNETVWWMVPRRREIAHLFVSNHGAWSRISGDHSISSEIHGRTAVQLRVPDEWSVLKVVIGATRRMTWAEDFTLKPSKPEFEDATVSDKGNYANGLLGLFQGLQQVGMFFENSFWRTIVERLCKRLESTETATLQAITNKLQKKTSILAKAASQETDVLDWLSRYTLQLARQQHLADDHIGFTELEGLFLEQYERCIVQNPHLREDSSEQGIKADRQEASRSLRRGLQYLTEIGAFQQGVRLRCGNCGSNYWQHVDDLGGNNKCPGCGADVPLSAESPWRYRLNSLLRNAVAFHGSMPLLLTLYGLRGFPTRHSFLLSPGVALFKKYSDRSPSAELDLVCISDGNLLVGEVKTSSAEFSQGELKKLADLAKTVHADVAVLGCYRDESLLDAKGAELQKMLSGSNCKVRVVAPSSHVFEPVHIA